jgi:shikimate kinase
MTSRKIANIALVGFMGVGKSSVGRMIAEQLGFTFLDTDEAIEERTGKSITQIFAELGEPVFRDLEKRLVAELATREKLVVSTGGGLAAHAGNMASLKTNSLVVCLWASPEAIYERVKTQTHRPLLVAPDPVAKIKELLAKREPFYRQADVLMNTERRSVKEVAQHVLHQFHVAARQM